MQPEDRVPTPQPATAKGAGNVAAGIIVLCIAFFGGGIWTILMFLGESLVTGGQNEQSVHYATLVTGVATAILMTAGIVMFMAGRGSNMTVSATASRFGTAAFCLIALAIGCYLFGFVLCFTTH